MRVPTVGPAGPDMHRRARLSFQDVGSWRVDDRGISSTSDGRCGPPSQVAKSLHQLPNQWISSGKARQTRNCNL
jgi:hypothetical protein